MVKNIIWACLLSPASLLAQGKGVAFAQDLSWQEILQKAAKEHKYVFVDCYASWCAPCKEMDRTVYIDDSVGTIINTSFVSVKVQMDSSKNDAEEVKTWYETAHGLQEKFHVTAFPTFLFFSPDGQVVHKAIGERNRRGFLEIAAAAIDSHRQYFTLLAQYKEGRLSYGDMPTFARCVQELGDTGLASQVTKNYLRYLQGLSDDDLWTKDHIGFIVHNKNRIHAKDSIFQRFFKDRDRINVIMADTGYADELINYFVFNDVVKPLVIAGIGSTREPQWRRIGKSIRKKFGPAYVEKNVIDGKVVYYRNTKRWELYSKYYILDLKLKNIDNWPASPMAGILLNNDAFEVFKHSNNSSELETALSWVDKAIAMHSKPDAIEMDTKANILYKLGRKEEGLKIEAESASLAPQDKEIQTALEKMKSGLPTWPVE